MVDTIYRTARVYTAAEWNSDSSGDSCRYDVAESLAKTAGYSKEKTDWYASYHIVKAAAAANVTAAALNALDEAVKSFEEAGVISDVKIQPLTAEEIAALRAAAEEKESAAEAEKTAQEWTEESDRVQAETLAALAPVIAAEEAAPAAEEAEALTPYERVIRKDPECKNAWRLPGYPGAVYSISYTDNRGGAWAVHFPSLREYQDAIEQLRRDGAAITKTTKTEAGQEEEIPAETRQEQTDRENREHCQRIAEEVEAYAEGRVYRCPDCGACITDENLFCDCGAQVDLISGEWEQLSLYDYFSDCLDIEYRCGSDREYRSCSIMITCGGPNIYIDTAEKAVLFYWWTDRARYYLSSDAVDAINDWAEEYWNCL